MGAGACSCPERFQLGGRLIHPLRYSETEKLFLVKCLLVFQHEIDGPSEFVGKNREGLGFSVFMGKPLEVLLPRFVSFEEKHRSLGESPFEVGITDLFTV